jgi:hypothetical protein
MTRVDLDEWERKARFVEERPPGAQLRSLLVGPEVALAVVAELRAAREVIAAVMDDTNDVSMRVDVALDNYEKAVGE